MKYKLVAIALFFAFMANAQKTITLKEENNTSHRLWLYNSKGVVLGDKDSVVAKDFFNADGVFIQSNMPYNKEDQYIVMISPPQGDRKAMFLKIPVIEEAIKEEILKSETELRLTFSKKVGEKYLSFNIIVR